MSEDRTCAKTIGRFHNSHSSIKNKNLNNLIEAIHIIRELIFRAYEDPRQCLEKGKTC